MPRIENTPGAVLCKHCGEHLTIDPTGVCSRCRRNGALKPPRQLCVICNRRMTRNEDGICSECARAHQSKEKMRRIRYNHQDPADGAEPVVPVGYEKETDNLIEDIIVELSLVLKILRRRKKGKSFAEIGKELKIPKSTCYKMFARALNRQPYRIIDVDGSVVDGLSAHEQREELCRYQPASSEDGVDGPNKD